MPLDWLITISLTNDAELWVETDGARRVVSELLLSYPAKCPPAALLAKLDRFESNENGTRIVLRLTDADSTLRIECTRCLRWAPLLTWPATCTPAELRKALARFKAAHADCKEWT